MALESESELALALESESESELALALALESESESESEQLPSRGRDYPENRSSGSSDLIPDHSIVVRSILDRPFHPDESYCSISPVYR